MHDGTIVPMGGAQSRFTSTIIQDGPHAGQYTAKLTIDKVTKEDEESDNVLVVQNELGNATYKFSLGVGERPPVGESCKTSLRSTLTLFSQLIVPTTVKTTQSNLSPSAHSRLFSSLTYDRLCKSGCMMEPQTRFQSSSGWKSMMESIKERKRRTVWLPNMEL